MHPVNHLIRQSRKIFRDSIVLRVRGGKGGPGLPKYGGIGGKGGDVIIKASRSAINFESIVKRSRDGLLQAGDGSESRRTRLLGQAGPDLILKVPVGVSIVDNEKQFVADLDEHNSQALVALGGRGGDKFSDNHGLAGQYRILKLDLKTISDYVFVGYPNAGKSSLLRAVSKAEPKVASYPFTTLRPYLGIVQYNDYRKITMADLPGLVEGAHKNIGLGHDFLKHIVRAEVLAFVIDINNVNLGPQYPQRSPLETLCILNKEIEMYDDTLLLKPSILLLSKMDSIPDAQQKFEEFKVQLEKLYAKCDNKDDDTSDCPIDPSLLPEKLIRFEEILPISSTSGHNITEFKNMARETLDKFAERKLRLKNYEEIMHLDTNRLRAN